MSKIVLLTGATGFLGGYLCAELLAQTDATVHCLVRGRTDEGARRRLAAYLAHRGIPRADLARVATVRADLRAPRLGLDDATHERLARTAGAIYHCGATVNLAADYERLASCNVEGTRAVTELAARAEVTLHHISSAGVFIDAPHVGHPEVDEDTVLEPGMPGEVGYTRTKFDGEEIVRASGVPAVIYRPAFITGDHATGESSASDLITRAIRASAVLGVAPDCATAMPTAPVDYVARGIVALSTRPAAVGRTFHLTQPEHLSMAEIFARLRARGYAPGSQPVTDWHATLQDRVAETSAFTMLALWRMGRYLLAETPRDQVPVVRSERTRAELSRLGVTCPVADTAYLDRIMGYLAASGLLAR
ncbi:oxidoreductase [Longispora fulva]|uniref:Thioester reductase-like protein n=1 Tax=Longispora fulva TaxID=619741 RepID=A0A8J7GPI7_9ACTN|nr:thioester reductase domain-containing protein [Longispora fulva]MBG6135553.1 thioester reductase-like protein [Longispora fulva]GIG56208.1 oxidoreductase [Longispora fulva]